MFQALGYKIGIWAVIILVIAIYPTVPVCADSQPIQARPSSYIVGAQARLEDGTLFKVHLQKNAGEQGHSYAREVLDAACAAYKEIVFKQGFNRPGYTFIQPTELFAYDSDKSIDIYIANVNSPFALLRPQGGLEYKAEIYLPADCKAYQKRYNIKHPKLELKASVAHELLHIIIYSYNRNMQTLSQGKFSLTSQRWDWYTEGLARYFESLAGYNDEYLSSGFRKECGRVVTVYKGGVNYFLEYPDKPLNERKYDFALFWRYLHENYGMDKIEEISSKFRQIDPQSCSNQEAMQMLARTLDTPLGSLLRNFSLYVYKASSVPASSEEGLEPVDISRLSCQRKETHNISSFGFDFYEVDLTKDLQFIQLNSLDGRRDLTCLIGIRSPFNFSSMPAEADASGKITIDAAGLTQNSKMIIMLSNPTNKTIPYRISVN